jgi:hypothetical protein
MRREAVTFPFFGAGLSEPAMADGHFGMATFLLTGGAVGLAYAATCAATAQAAADAFPMSGPPLGFGICGGALTAAAATSAVGGIA